MKRGRPLVVVAAVLAAVHALRVYESLLSDDAYILFRYARNLVREGALVWNPGEPPIDGFTSLLHVLLYAAGLRLGVDPEVLSQLIGVTFAAASCVAAAWLAAEVSGTGRAAVLAAFVVALSPDLAFWARGGLETTCFTALMCLAMAGWLHERRQRGRRVLSGSLFLLATLSRPEAFGLAAIAVVWDCATAARRDGRAVRALAAWWPYAVPIGALLVWRLWYFGDLLPNTYYAKSGGGLFAVPAGLLYDFRFLRTWGAVGLLLAAAPLVLTAKPRAEAIFVTLCTASYLAYVAKLGGDYQGGFRYLVPLLPWLAALTATGAVLAWDATLTLPRLRRPAAAGLVLGLAMGELAWPSARELRELPERLTRPWRVLDRDVVERSHFVLMGKCLKRHVRPGSRVGALAVGAIGWYSELPILDLFGLNDRRIARLPLDLSRRDRWRPGHMKGSAREVLRAAPDYLVLALAPAADPELPPEEERRWYPFIDDLLRDASFREQYVLESLLLGDGRWLNLYRRR